VTLSSSLCSFCHVTVCILQVTLTARQCLQPGFFHSFRVCFVLLTTHVTLQSATVSRKALSTTTTLLCVYCLLQSCFDDSCKTVVVLDISVVTVTGICNLVSGGVFLTCHRGAGGEYRSVSRLGLLIGNRWILRRL